MDTRLTAEQAELQRSARQLARELGPATVGDLEDDVRRKRLVAAVRDAGWLELRDDAGAGAPLASGVEAAIVAEALGAAVADVAFTGPLLAADLTRRAGLAPARSAVVAFDADLRASGTAVAIDCAEDTSAAIAAASGQVWRVGVGAPLPGADLTRALRSVDEGATTVGTLAADDIVQWSALGLALTSADLVGVMRGVLDVTVGYANDRKQYGVAVGSFQAVQHLLAEAYTLLEGSLSVAQHAAWAVDALEPTAAVEASRIAKAYCARAARTVCETAIQVHGGIGNTWEHIAHVYLRRALLSTQWFGDDGVQLRELEALRLAGRAGGA
jgi:alkylation response protein AidB-like acyl-CoA dehydrogenase